MATSKKTKYDNFLQDEVKDHHQILTNKIIEKMQEAVKYEKPWMEAQTLPYNPVTKVHYRGINMMSLLLGGYTDNRFYTFNGLKQLSEETGKNIHVRKGEKGIAIFKAVNQTFKKINEESEEEKSFSLWRQVYAGTVFNASQIEGLEPENKPLIENFDTNEELSQIIQAMQSTGLKLNHGNISKAYYQVTPDEINLPNKENFKSQAHYYRTVMHELIHSTGHPSRLNRNLSGGFGSKDYSKEELVAELGSYFMGAHLSLPYDGSVHDNHAAYLKSWLQILQEDKNAIFRAASAASKAVDFQINLKNEYFKVNDNSLKLKSSPSM